MSVRELRVALVPEEYEAAIALYRDGLGLSVLEVWDGPSGRGVLLQAGRATLELLSPEMSDSVDRIEVGRRKPTSVRLAFEVGNSDDTSRKLAAAGATLLGSPVVTPWRHRNVRLSTPDRLQITLFSPISDDAGHIPGGSSDDPSADDLHLSRVLSARAGMLVRRPPGEVFQAFVDPSLTTQFWFTKSSGALVSGARVHWEWEMYGVSTTVVVKEVEENRLLLLDWGVEDKPTTVEFRFIPWRDDSTYVRVTETGLSGNGDELVARVANSTGGFTIVLCAAKALLEHDVMLTVVGDHMPAGLEL
jgi:uncharacterized protein YndB with AHSA1/START domain